MTTTTTAATVAELRRLVSLAWRCPDLDDVSAVELMVELLSEIASLEAPPEALVARACRIPRERGRRA